MLIDLSNFPILRSDLQYRTPGDTEMRALDGSGSQTLGRSPGFFSGFLEIGGNYPDELRGGLPPDPVEYDGDQNHRARVELLLVRLRGPGQTFQAPLLRRPGGMGLGTVPPVILAASWVAGKVVVRVAGGLVGGLVAGDYVNMSNRLFILSSSMSSSGTFTVLPAILPRVGDPCIFRNPYAIAKIDRELDGIKSLHDADFSGPWDIPWNEAIPV